MRIAYNGSFDDMIALVQVIFWSQAICETIMAQFNVPSETFIPYCDTQPIVAAL